MTLMPLGMRTRVWTGADPDRRWPPPTAVLKHERSHRRRRVRRRHRRARSPAAEPGRFPL